MSFDARAVVDDIDRDRVIGEDSRANRDGTGAGLYLLIAAAPLRRF